MRKERERKKKFKNEIFSLYHDKEHEKQMKFEKEEEEEKKIYLMQINLINGLMNKKQT